MKRGSPFNNNFGLKTFYIPLKFFQWNEKKTFLLKKNQFIENNSTNFVKRNSFRMKKLCVYFQTCSKFKVFEVTFFNIWGFLVSSSPTKFSDQVSRELEVCEFFQRTSCFRIREIV